MRHVRVNDHATFAVPLIFPAEIDGFVKSHRSFELIGLQTPDVVNRRFRIHAQRQHCRIGGDHQIIR